MVHAVKGSAPTARSRRSREDCVFALIAPIALQLAGAAGKHDGRLREAEIAEQHDESLGKDRMRRSRVAPDRAEHRKRVWVHGLDGEQSAAPELARRERQE